MMKVARESCAGAAAEVDADIVLPWDGSNHYLAAVYRTELASQIDDLVAAGEPEDATKRYIRASY